jgi:predicted NAD/FAD-dependent oxidoreductase
VEKQIIIGAGFSGLALASLLKLRGKDVLVIEKSRGLGGRVATRRDGLAAYDHGAQFLKVKPDENSDFAKKCVQKGVAELWFSDLKNNFLSSPGGLKNLAKQLSQDLVLVLEEKVHCIQELSNGQLGVETESGKSFLAENCFLTCPLPQALDILTKSRIAFDPGLSRVTYAKAAVGLFEIEGPLGPVGPLDEIKYLSKVNESIFSVSNQKSKKVSSTLAFTVVMEPTWSEKYFDNSDSDILGQLEVEFSNWLRSQDPGAQIKKSQLKKWRYSHPLNLATTLFARAGARGNIYLLGDAFGGGSIGGALRSAEGVAVFLETYASRQSPI